MPLPRKFIDDEDISFGLKNGKYELLLEHHKLAGGQCYCARADCFVERLGETDRLQSQYRIQLSVKGFKAQKENRRFFHVSCLESMPVDIMTKYLALPEEQSIVQSSANTQQAEVSTTYFHPAICDWVIDDGKAFEPHRYNGEYSQALDSYRQDMKQAKLKHATACTEQCDCGLSLLERPESRNFIAGNARKFKWLLSDVLLEVMEIDYCGAITVGDRVALVEGITQRVHYFDKDNLPDVLAATFKGIEYKGWCLKAHDRAMSEMEAGTTCSRFTEGLHKY